MGSEMCIRDRTDDFQAVVSSRTAVSGDVLLRNDGDVVGKGEGSDLNPGIASGFRRLTLLGKAAVLESLIAYRELHGSGLVSGDENWQKFRGDVALARIAVKSG